MGRVLGMNDEPPVPPPDPELTAPAEFATFMRAYQDMVFTTAARLTGNAAQAEDIAQDVFLKAYQNFAGLKDSPTAGGWLKTVATNLSLNYLSRYRRRWRFFSEFRRTDDAADSAATPEADFAAPDTFFAGLEAAERYALVERALAQLPEHQRVPLVLHHFDGLAYGDIAQKLGVSLSKVKTDIRRARAALAQRLLSSDTSGEDFNFRTP